MYCLLQVHLNEYCLFSSTRQGVKKVPDPKQNYIGLMTEG